ncbi:MAG: Tat pathway signal protein, partial [Pseudolabrys sp.]|nr:Tat pathway signal protein [Pseudolabrys sp.]
MVVAVGLVRSEKVRAPVTSRRTVLIGSGLIVGGAAAGFLAWPGDDPAYRDAVAANRGKMVYAGGARIDAAELVRFATLAANSHNTQPWLFSARDATIRITPDVSRRCAVVDPEDRHLVASLGCAAENLVLAAAAAGFTAAVEFENAGRAATVSLDRSRPQSSRAFWATPTRQSTRAPFDPAPVAA